MYLMPNIIESLKKLDNSIYIFDEENPYYKTEKHWSLEFHLGLDPTTGQYTPWLELNIQPKNIGVTLGDSTPEAHQTKFEVFPILQSILDTNFSENTNDDGCSYQYEFDTDHDSGDRISFKVTITDYLS